MAGEFARPLPESWEVRRLDEVATIIDSLHKTPSYSDVGSPMVRVTDVQGGFLDLAKTLHVSDEVFQEFTRRYAPKKGDIVFSRVGSYGNVSYARTDTPFCLGQNTALISPRINGRFLHLFLQSAEARWQIEQVVVGSTQKTISLKSISALQIPIPPPDELEAIAAVLGTLDDKIELNWRMNATLEAMARSLFQSWFVDFDPVRAKLDGREPFGLDPGIAALFPDAFQDSELGRIPNGWTLGRVLDASDFSRSSISPGGFPDETFDHYSLPAFDEGRTPKAELGGAIMSNKLDVTRDSVLLSKLNPHIPRIWLPDLHATRRSVCSTEFIVATPRFGYSREYLFSLFTSAAFASSYCTLVTGTTGSHQRIRPDSVLDMKTVISPPPLVEAFTAVAKPMFDQVNRNIDQSRTLATLRDTLLPKLLSGELSFAGIP
jgi:type I restriction enzyme S subunit